MEDIKFRIATEKDRRGILSLIKHVFHCTWTEEYLKWKYDQCPYGKAITWIAEHNNKIIGMRSLRPIVMEISGEYHKVILLGDVAVHSSYRRKGIFSCLVDCGTKWTIENGYEMSITFPNKRSIGEYKKRKDWIMISFTLLIKPINISRIIKRKIKGILGRIMIIPFKIGGIFSFRKLNVNLQCKNDIKVKLVKEYPQEIMDFSSSLSNLFRLKKDKSYLDWRYCKNPSFNYYNFVAYDKERPCGYIVGIERNLLGLKLGLIADIDGEEDALESLIDSIVVFFKSQDVDVIGILLPQNNLIYKKLIWKAGFIPLPKCFLPRSFAGFVSFHTPNLKDFFYSNNWFLIWGDWDILEGSGISL